MLRYIVRRVVAAVIVSGVLIVLYGAKHGGIRLWH